jgi:SAM-dependent methyltransferase
MLSFIGECHDRLVDWYYELYLNIDTKGFVSKKELKLNHQESIEYGAVYYKYLISALDKVSLDQNKTVLLDYGCGKGRLVAYAASCNYRKIIGIEISNIIDVCYKNVSQMKRRQVGNIILLKCNAQNYVVPHDVNVIYFYNPFVGNTLKKVIENIHCSFIKNPRNMYIIFFNNECFDEMIVNQGWLKKIHQQQPHPDISCGLYETVY